MDWTNRRVLVTGGTGSFGHFIVHALLKKGVKEVRVFSRDEKKQYDMRMRYRDRPELTFVLGDIRNLQTTNEAMEGVDVVMQAAALKQVPTCELFPMEAVQTNLLGVENVVAAALRHGIDIFVTISTDKAVKPVNVMGMTKALQERIVLRGNLSRYNHGTRFAAVRYGNVLSSRGSIVPAFRKSLRLGQKLFLTDERMTRFLLTLGDSIELVLFAAANLKGGEVFVRKAPAARVMDIAQVLCEEAGKALAYEVMGIMPGEKINEILVSEEELVRTEDMADYYKIHPWWEKDRPNAIEREYSSRDSLVSLTQIKELLARSDNELAEVGLDL
jgi:UDP-glucose 4-epimerase